MNGTYATLVNREHVMEQIRAFCGSMNHVAAADALCLSLPALHGLLKGQGSIPEHVLRYFGYTAFAYSTQEAEP